MAQRVTRIVCGADPHGSAELVERLNEAAAEHDAQVVAMTGDLSDGHGGSEGYRAVFRALGEGGRSAYWVPGPADAPVVDYLREAANIEVVFPFLHGVHGTAAFAPDGHLVFAGLGGEISDDPEEPRDELERLRYPRWEVEYRLKVLNELGEHQPVLTFWTPPAHKGLGEPGAEVLAELVATYRPRLVICDGERGSRTIGRSMVVSPGSLTDGHYAVVDLQARKASLETLEAART